MSVERFHTAILCQRRESWKSKIGEMEKGDVTQSGDVVSIVLKGQNSILEFVPYNDPCFPNRLLYLTWSLMVSIKSWEKFTT